MGVCVSWEHTTVCVPHVQTGHVHSQLFVVLLAEPTPCSWMSRVGGHAWCEQLLASQLDPQQPPAATYPASAVKEVERRLILMRLHCFGPLSRCPAQ
jgi:hypothetical protein